MLPASMWPAIDNAALALLSLVVSALLAVLVPALLRWANEHAAAIKDAHLRAFAQTVVQGLEQGLKDAAGPEKKLQAVALLRSAFPTASTQAINVAVEAAVYALPKALAAYQASIVPSVTTTAAAPATVISAPTSTPTV